MDLILVLLAVAVIIFFYRLITSRSGDLETSGIAHEKPWPIIGNIFSILSGSEGIIQYLERTYWKFSNESEFLDGEKKHFMTDLTYALPILVKMLIHL